MNQRPDLIKRNIANAIGFENQFIPEPNSGCWLWIGAVNNRGYGKLFTCGKSIQAHRHSWAIHFGGVPNGQHVLHRCDTPACVNPKHLFLGTNADNVYDKMKKGRHIAPKGTANGCSKLNDEIVRSIRLDNRPNTVICKDFGVSNVLISLIKRKQAWRHVQ